jgi:hypothetical protein
MGRQEGSRALPLECIVDLLQSQLSGSVREGGGWWKRLMRICMLEEEDLL